MTAELNKSSGRAEWGGRIMVGAGVGGLLVVRFGVGLEVVVYHLRAKFCKRFCQLEISKK